MAILGIATSMSGFHNQPSSTLRPQVVFGTHQPTANAPRIRPARQWYEGWLWKPDIEAPITTIWISGKQTGGVSFLVVGFDALGEGKDIKKGGYKGFWLGLLVWLFGSLGFCVEDFHWGGVLLQIGFLGSRFVFGWFKFLSGFIEGEILWGGVTFW